MGVSWYIVFELFLGFVVKCLLNAQNFRNLIKSFQEFLKFSDFSTIKARCKTASVPLHYGQVIMQWFALVES